MHYHALLKHLPVKDLFLLNICNASHFLKRLSELKVLVNIKSYFMYFIGKILFESKDFLKDGFPDPNRAKPFQEKQPKNH